MTLEIAPLRPSQEGRPSASDGERCWEETNCYIDAWRSLLAALGLEADAAGAFALSSDFEGDQWTFLKYPTEDLRTLYGIDVAEMNISRSLVEHVEEQMGFGRPLTVEVDAWYLPDTAGVSYHDIHEKTTIIPQSLDVEGRSMRYFHNTGLYRVDGDDFDGVLRMRAVDPAMLPPYVECIKLERLDVDPSRLVRTAIDLLRGHLNRRACDNPMRRLGKRIVDDLMWIGSGDLDRFHQYAFGTCRQCGSAAEIAAIFLRWLTAHGEEGMDVPSSAFVRAARSAKTLQFGLARVARGRKFDVEGPLEEMADAWDEAISQLIDRYGV